MLTWPALFGVLAVAAVQLTFGGTMAKDADVRSFDHYLVAYHAGAIAMALLIALFLTWIVYRIAGRSQTASHATFFALIGLFCLSIYSQHMRHRAHSAGEGETSLDLPSERQESGRETRIAFDGKISLNLPAGAKMVDANDPHKCGLAIMNARTRSTDMDAVLQLVDLPPGDTIDAASERIILGMRKQNPLADSFVWHTVQGTHKSLMTQPVDMPDGPRPVHVIWAMAQLDGNQIVLINFSIFSREPIERSDYVVVAQKIVESIAINNPSKL